MANYLIIGIESSSASYKRKSFDPRSLLEVRMLMQSDNSFTPSRDGHVFEKEGKKIQILEDRIQIDEDLMQDQRVRDIAMITGSNYIQDRKGNIINILKYYGAYARQRTLVS